jgi:hypothetical protein
MDETNASTETKTFTQDEVNQIVQDRLFKERKKYGEVDIDALKASTDALKGQLADSAAKLSTETERADKLQAELDAIKKANEVRDIREQIAKESNIPADLLHGETLEDCKAEAERLVEFARPKGYPTVKDGGEVMAPAVKQSTKEQFAEWIGDALN